MHRLSNSVTNRSKCPACGSQDVRGMPSPHQHIRYRSFGCGRCNKRWTMGRKGPHRGYIGPLLREYLSSQAAREAK